MLYTYGENYELAFFLNFHHLLCSNRTFFAWIRTQNGSNEKLVAATTMYCNHGVVHQKDLGHGISVLEIFFK